MGTAKLKREILVNLNQKQKCHKSLQNDTPNTGSIALKDTVQWPRTEQRLWMVIITLNNRMFQAIVFLSRFINTFYILGGFHKKFINFFMFPLHAFSPLGSKTYKVDIDNIIIIGIPCWVTTKCKPVKW